MLFLAQVLQVQQLLIAVRLPEAVEVPPVLVQVLPELSWQRLKRHRV